MDGSRFDSLTRSFAFSRRLILSGVLAAGLRIVAGDETGAKKKNKHGGGGKSCPKGQRLVAEQCVVDRRKNPCYPHRVLCPDKPIRCCSRENPVCGPWSAEAGGHVCCPISRSKICPPGPHQPAGHCCKPQQECCNPGFNGWRICCDKGTICCPGRADTGMPGCCPEERSCCLDDNDCAENEVCDNLGCCKPQQMCLLPLQPRSGRTRTHAERATDLDCCAPNGVACDIDADCCEDEDICEDGICKRKRGDVCDDTIICRNAYPYCVLGTCNRCPLDQVSTGTDELCCQPTRYCPNAKGGRGACCANEGCCVPDEDGTPCGKLEFPGLQSCVGLP